MASFSRLQLYLCLLLILFSFKQIAIAEDRLITNINIGVLAYRGEMVAYEQWIPTANHLSEQIPGYRFHIVPVSLDNIGEMIEEKRVSFVLTNPASFVELEHQFGIFSIATLRNKRLDGAYTKFGGVIFTRTDQTDINSLKDVKGKDFMAVHPNAFGGWWMAWREFLDHGIDPYKDFKSVQYSGFPQDKIVMAVIKGDVDVGTVRTDVIEHMVASDLVEIDQLKIIQHKKHPQFPFALSTQLYPEWPFAVASHTSKDLAQQVALILLRMPKEHVAAKAAKSMGWSVSTDYYKVQELMHRLKVGHHAGMQDIVLEELFKKYWYLGIFFAIVIVVLIIVLIGLISLYSRLKQSSHELRAEIKERVFAQKNSQLQQKRLRALYDISSLSNLSFNEQVNQVLKTGGVMLETEIARVCKIDVELNTSTAINAVAPEDMDIAVGVAKPLDKTFCLFPFVANKSIAIHNVGESQWRDEVCYKFSGFESYVAAPILVNGTKFGTISFASRAIREQEFDDNDIDFVQQVGRWVGVAFERQNAISMEQEKAVAQASNQAKSEFLAKVSHELRTPLNAILGYSELLSEELQEVAGAQGQKDLQKIHSSGRHLLSLINDLLDLSKIEAGKLEIVKEYYSLKDMLLETVSTMQTIALKNSNKLELNYDSDVDAMYGDVLRVRQTLFNILGNAAKFTQNGCITLKVLSETIGAAHMVKIIVSDTGIGINDDQLAKLFTEFTQANKNISRSYGGTGLGLAISRRLCELMGGSISVTSSPDVGSAFTIMLPVDQTYSDISGSINDLSGVG